MTQLHVDQLAGHLKQPLLPVYFIHGDETLLVNECADAIRRAARSQGYSDRQVFSVEAGFNWNSLLAASDSLSLFAERRILELRLPTGKPGKEGARILREYAERLPEDTLLLIVSAKLEAAARRNKWVQSLDKAGASLPVWPVEPARLPAWIGRRLHARGLQASDEALQLIADRVEGNLLAADQEVEKLYLLHGEGQLDLDTVTELVTDSARYDVFGLVDAALAGEAAHTQRMLSGLRAEGVEPVLVLWALSREIRSLTVMARQLQSGSSLGQVLAAQRVWDKRKPQVSAALKHIRGRQWWQLLQTCNHIDRVVKGRAAGSAWDELLQLALRLSGVPILKLSA
ncbi:DNA polymerase III delta subunit [hydrothermal vent metagenome]|uniref:DNA polymerase III subunit delta n=1 Tax=hydrothermal vent metagenome TaxID=652676 RepID=A0A3B0Z149_9ZZZZ